MSNIIKQWSEISYGSTFGYNHT